MKPFFVYMLRCSDGSYYVGHTDDLDTRMAQHATGALGGYTASRRPLTLAWVSEAQTRDEAFQFEMQAKRWSRAKKEAFVRADWAGLKRLARGPDRVPGGRPSTTRRASRGATLGASGVDRTASGVDRTSSAAATGNGTPDA